MGNNYPDEETYPNTIDGESLEDILRDLQENEIPVIVREDGTYEPINRKQPQTIGPNDRVDKILRVPEGKILFKIK